jgi:hypothetical protein
VLSGIFWLDDGMGRGLDQSVALAAASYRSRFHREPTLCLVPTGILHGQMSRLGQLIVQEHAALPRHHLWIGIEDSRRAACFSLSLRTEAEAAGAPSARLSAPPQAFRRNRSIAQRHSSRK